MSDTAAETGTDLDAAPGVLLAPTHRSLWRLSRPVTIAATAVVVSVVAVGSTVLLPGPDKTPTQAVGSAGSPSTAQPTTSTAEPSTIPSAEPSSTEPSGQIRTQVPEVQPADLAGRWRMSTVDLQDGSGPIDVEPGGATVTFTLNTVKITYGSRGWQTASYTVDEDAISFDHVVKNSELAGTGTAQADIVTLAAVLSLVQPEGPLPLSLAAGRLSVDVESNRSVLTAMPTTSLPVDGSTIGPLHRYTVVFTYIGEVPEPR